ncbi:MAG: 2-oxoacid:acceptor oxidoreductase family protein [Candidatus Lambdaproteobacteria bacterium]|nr:2-oxoacid:acceptor oxidoreductase family protein [Candidatus Lambdaproteobacteria bacterium]
MFRVRFHGRGGQGVKTASRVLGTALFHAGFEVQDAPRYGAERRGAPIFAYVRADRQPIFERGVIVRPDLVVVVDDTLLTLPAAAVLQGIAPHTLLLVHSAQPAEALRAKLKAPGQLVTIAPREVAATGLQPQGAMMTVGAAARLLGVVPRQALESAAGEELAALPAKLRQRSLALTLDGFDGVEAPGGPVRELPAEPAEDYDRPRWIALPFEDARIASPTIYGAGTSMLSKTGLWRVQRPVIDRERCRRCVWVCGTYCPDNAIAADAGGYPVIDYDHCKGCMICLVNCPSHAIAAVVESQAREAAAAGDAP